MLHTAGGVNGIRRLVLAIDEIAGAPGRFSGNAAKAARGIDARSAAAGKGARSSERLIHALESRGPAVLCQVVVIQAKTGTKHRFSAISGSVSETDAWSKLLAVIVRDAYRNLQRLQRHKGWILCLALPGSREQTESSLPSQSIVHRQMSRGAPGVLCIHAQPLDVLREAPVGCGSCGSSICIIDGKLREIGPIILGVEGRIVRKRVQRFPVSRKGTAQHRLVNEIHSKLKGVIACGMTQVITELVLFLISQGGEQGDRRRELVVSVGFEPGNRQGRGTEWKSQRESQSGVPRLR